MTTLDVTGSSEIQAAGPTSTATGLDLLDAASADDFAIDGGTVTLSADTGGSGPSLMGMLASTGGQVIQDGSLTSTDVTVGGSIDFDGTSLSIALSISA